MRSTMHEMSRSSSEAASLARSGVDVAATAGETIGRLSDASEQIGDILRLITSVAEQTNLLALNATIERPEPATPAAASARGRRGQGAAQETTRATENIATRIAGIQHSSSARSTRLRRSAASSTRSTTRS
jgi:methyl-accepting chemotaxis protein